MKFAEFIEENYKPNEYIARMNIPENHSGPVSTYHYNSNAIASTVLENDVNVYISMNPMKWIDKQIRRDIKHVSSLKWLYCDLDIYHSDYKDLSKEQILWILEEDIFGKKIPYPTYVIDSGRGMYCFWRIDEHVKALPRWKKVQQYFHSHLLEFGSDNSVVTDSARVFRAIGGVNSKSGTTVKVLKHYDDKVYTLYEIMQGYCPELIFTSNKTNDNNEFTINKKKNSKKGDKKDTGKTKGSNLVFLNTPYTLYSLRVADLETLLIKHRDIASCSLSSNEKISGKRECILFLYRYWTLCITNDKEMALNKTIELNSRLNNPLSVNEVTKATKSAEKYYDESPLRWSNQKIIEFLDITSEEQKDMRFIISKAEKSRRKSVKNRKRYLESLYNKGASTYDVTLKRRLKAVYSLLNEGKKQAEICEILNISRSTFYNYKKKLALYTKEELNFISNDVLASEEAVENDNIVKTEVSEEAVETVVNSGTFSFENESPKNSALEIKREYGVHMQSMHLHNNIIDTTNINRGYSIEYWDEDLRSG